MHLFEVSRAGEALKQIIGRNIKWAPRLGKRRRLGSKSHAKRKSDVISMLCLYFLFCLSVTDQGLSGF